VIVKWNSQLFRVFLTDLLERGERIATAGS
jgi:hypothetical protein